MIKVEFLIENEKTTGFEIKGHADFAEKGEDAVCAAVSSAAYMAANTITEIIGADAEAEARDGEMTLKLKASDERTETVLKGLKLHLTQLSKQFPEAVEIILRRRK